MPLKYCHFAILGATRQTMTATLWWWWRRRPTWPISQLTRDPREAWRHWSTRNTQHWPI